MNSNSFNNKKSLSQQDGCDDHTGREKPARAYNSNTMPQALPAGAITTHKSWRSVEVLLVGVRETPITAMEFTVSWPALYLNENYVVWVIGQWLKDPAKSGDMTQIGLLEFKSFFFLQYFVYRTQ